MLFAPAQTTYFNDMRDQDNLFKLIAALSFVLINLNIFFESRKIFFQAGIVLVFVAEILLGTSIFDRPSRVYPYQSPPFVSYLRKDPDSFRIFGMDNILYPNIATAYQIQDIRWLNALIPQRVYDFSLRFIGTEEELNTIRYTGITFPKSVKMMNLLNVKYIISAAELDGRVGQSAQFHNVYFDKNIHVYQNDDVLPRAFVVHHVLNVDGFQEALNQMDVSSFDPAQVAVVENLPAELSMLINQHEQLGLPSVGAVKLVNSGQLDVTVTSESPGLLVVTDQYYPGWQVFVDGEQSTLYAVDGIFRGVFLEKGFHSIQFKYRPLSFIIGAIISILSLLVVVIFIISTLKVLHKNE
jgi:hypothetical protein